MCTTTTTTTITMEIQTTIQLIFLIINVELSRLHGKKCLEWRIKGEGELKARSRGGVTKTMACLQITVLPFPSGFALLVFSPSVPFESQ